VKERIKEKKNRIWEVKCKGDRQYDWGFMIDRSMMFPKEFAKWFPIFWVVSNHQEGVDTT
jgi:hypothetical protein